MVVTTRLFHIISIVCLVIGLILSAVGITLIIVSSTTQCNSIETEPTVTATLPSTSSASTVPSSECPIPTCHSTMFGATLQLGQKYGDWDPDLEDPDKPAFKDLAKKVSNLVVASLESSTTEVYRQFASEVSSDVSYDVQVYRFASDGKDGVNAYTSGVAVSAGPVEELPSVTVIESTLEANLAPSLDGPDSVSVKDPSYECPVCSLVTECPILSTTDCPTSSPSDSPFSCSTCPPTVITTQCPPTTTCPTPTVCPNCTTVSDCTTVLPTECPVCPTEGVSTECPHSTCPTIDCPHCALTTECPTIIPTDCPHQECTCPPLTTVVPSDCPLATVSECPHQECTPCPLQTTSLPSDCPVTECPTTSSTPDCSKCPTEIPTTECPTVPVYSNSTCPPSTDCPTCNCPTEGPTTCPTIISTDCPTQDCTPCPSDSFTPQQCPTPSDTPQDCSHCPVVTTEVSCPTPPSRGDSTECPTIPSTIVTDCPNTCQSTIFGAQLSLVEKWNSALDDADSDEFKALADTTKQMVKNALEASDSTVNYNVQVDRFTENKAGGTTFAFTSGDAMSNEDKTPPSVADIRKALNNSPIGAVVEDNELLFCPYLPPSPQLTTLSSTGSTHESDTTLISTTPSLNTPPDQSTTERSQSTTQLIQSTTIEDVQTQSTAEENVQSTTALEYSSTREVDTTQSSPSVTTTANRELTTTPIDHTTSQEEHTSQSTLTTLQSTTNGDENTQSTSSVYQTTTEEVDTTLSTIVIDKSTTQWDEKKTTSLSQTTSQGHEKTESTTPLESTTHETEGTHSTTVSHATTEESIATQSSTASESPLTSQPVEYSSQSTSTSPEEISSTPESTLTTPSIHSHTTNTDSEFSTTSTESDTVTTSESGHSTTEKQEVSSILADSSTQSTLPSTEAVETTLPSQTTPEEKTTVLTTEPLTTLSSTTELWTTPSTVACTGREVINGDVYLLFDYTLYGGTGDETMAIEKFITDILFTFDGNDYFFGPSAGVIPLPLYVLHYPIAATATYTPFLITPITSLDHLGGVIDAINTVPPTATESNMKDALQAIYDSAKLENPPSIILISKSDEFVDEAMTIADQLMTDKKFNIIGVPLNGADLTPLTNHDDIPLDATSRDSQIDAATQIDAILKSISTVCISTVPTVSIASTSPYTTASTTTGTTTTRASCASSLDDQSIAFVYQLNYGVADRNSKVITNVLNSAEVKASGKTSMGAVFPFPGGYGVPSQWAQLSSGQVQVYFNIFNPPLTATGATIADGLQSLIDNPGPSHQIVIIIANSDDEVSSAVDLAASLKETSTIITLAYGQSPDGTPLDLSSLASSPQFTLTQLTQDYSDTDSTQAASLLLDSILQSTCQ